MNRDCCENFHKHWEQHGDKKHTCPCHSSEHKESGSVVNLYCQCGKLLTSKEDAVEHVCNLEPSPTTATMKGWERKLEELVQWETPEHEREVKTFIHKVVEEAREEGFQNLLKQNEEAYTTGFEAGKAQGVKELLPDIIGKHNAKILNEFQGQMKPDLPMICFDERVALIPAIEKATKETLAHPTAEK